MKATTGTSRNQALRTCCHAITTGHHAEPEYAEPAVAELAVKLRESLECVSPLARGGHDRRLQGRRARLDCGSARAGFPANRISTPSLVRLQLCYSTNTK